MVVLNGEPDHAPPAVDKMFVSLGLKLSPPPVANGNPDTKVWIDVRTALYYCRGEDAFGKLRKADSSNNATRKLDHFEPESGKPCE